MNGEGWVDGREAGARLETAGFEKEKESEREVREGGEDGRYSEAYIYVYMCVRWHWILMVRGFTYSPSSLTHSLTH